MYSSQFPTLHAVRLPSTHPIPKSRELVQSGDYIRYFRRDFTEYWCWARVLSRKDDHLKLHLCHLDTSYVYDEVDEPTVPVSSRRWSIGRDFSDLDQVNHVVLQKSWCRDPMYHVTPQEVWHWGVVYWGVSSYRGDFKYRRTWKQVSSLGVPQHDWELAPLHYPITPSWLVDASVPKKKLESLTQLAQQPDLLSRDVYFFSTGWREASLVEVNLRTQKLTYQVTGGDRDYQISVPYWNVERVTLPARQMSFDPTQEPQIGQTVQYQDQIWQIMDYRWGEKFRVVFLSRTEKDLSKSEKWIPIQDLKPVDFPVSQRITKYEA